MDNIFIKRNPAGNIKADEEKSNEMIDDAVATIMALDRAIRNGNQNTESVYDRRGTLVFWKLSCSLRKSLTKAAADIEEFSDSHSSSSPHKPAVE